MSKPTTTKTFPDFFYSKDPIVTNVTSFKYKQGIYHMCNVKSGQPEVESVPNLAPYEDNDEGMMDCMEIEDSYEIVQTKSGKFMTSFYVPPALISVIIGPKGSKLRQLEERTSTQIKVPRINETGNVKITGNSERHVASARNQVEIVTLNKRERLPITHFVSVPINIKEIQENFLKFKEEVLNRPPTRGINESIFQSPDKLHLTLTVLTLLDQTEIDEAKRTFNSCYQDTISKTIAQNPPEINVKDLEIMNDDASEVHVLYAKIHDPSGKLQKIANDIEHYFYKKGLVKKQYDNVKLHLTLMNSKLNKETDQEIGRRRISFDATEILKNYTNYNFGKLILKDMHLSIRGTAGENKFYNPEIIIDI